jgi:hypothetical protein
MGDIVERRDVEMNEHDIQRYAVAALRKLGYTVIVTSNRRRTSNTRGTPDTFVWAKKKWKALEFKQPSGKLTKEQTLLCLSGQINIVTSVEEAIRVVSA